MSLPAYRKSPHENAMYKSILFRPVHRSVQDDDVEDYMEEVRSGMRAAMKFARSLKERTFMLASLWDGLGVLTLRLLL